MAFRLRADDGPTLKLACKVCNFQAISETFFVIFQRGGGLFPLSPLFVAFPCVVTSTGPGGFMICVFII